MMSDERVITEGVLRPKHDPPLVPPGRVGGIPTNPLTGRPGIAPCVRLPIAPAQNTETEVPAGLAYVPGLSELLEGLMGRIAVACRVRQVM